MIVGLVEAMTGLGLIVGPIIGSALYSFFGYKQTFFIYGGFLVFLSIIIRIFFPTNTEREEEIKTRLLEGYSQDNSQVVFEGTLVV